MPKQEFFVTAESGAGKRLDVFLAENLQGLTRSQVQKIVAEKKASVGGMPRRAGYKLHIGDKVRAEYEIPGPEPVLGPEPIPLKILYQDADVIILDKPSGLVVHPGAGNRAGTLANALIHHFPELARIGPEDRPGIVHRLDKETSGVMVAARSERAYDSLKRQFERRDVWKIYLGLVWGTVSATEGKISWPVGRHQKEGKRMSIRPRSPKKAETFFKVLRNFRDTTFLEIQPVTGRTHQIRVHLAAAGHPIVGDPLYGRKKDSPRFPRLFLHAHTLSFLHPGTGERLTFASQLPPELEAVLAEEPI